MPLPNPNVLDGFIELYRKYRKIPTEPEPTGVFSSVVNSGKKIGNYVFGGNPDDNIVDTCQGMINKFRNNQSTVEKWLNVATDLAEGALKAQRAKSQSVMSKTQSYFATKTIPPESLLCNTLHAIRTYILFQLMNDEDLKAQVLAIQKKKMAEYNELKEKVEAARKEHNDATESWASLVKVVTYLADTGHEDFIQTAINFKLLTELPRQYLDECNIPFTYHADYFLMLYEKVYRVEVTHDSFETWENKQILTLERATPTRSTPSPVGTGMFSARGSQESYSSKSSAKEGSPSSSSEDISDIPPPPPPRLGGTSHSASQGDPT